MTNPTARRYPVYRPTGIPDAGRRKVPIWNAPPGEPTKGRIIQREIVKVGTHWLTHEVRSVLCRGVAGECPFDHKIQTYRWTGYVLIYMMPYTAKNGKRDPGGVRILHITPGAIRSCPVLDDARLDLTKYDIVTWRKGETKRSEQQAEIMERRDPQTPDPFDLFEYLVGTFEAPNNDARRAQKARVDG